MNVKDGDVTLNGDSRLNYKKVKHCRSSIKQDTIKTVTIKPHVINKNCIFDYGLCSSDDQNSSLVAVEFDENKCDKRSPTANLLQVVPGVLRNKNPEKDVIKFSSCPLNSDYSKKLNKKPTSFINSNVSNDCCQETDFIKKRGIESVFSTYKANHPHLNKDLLLFSQNCSSVSSSMSNNDGVGFSNVISSDNCRMLDPINHQHSTPVKNQNMKSFKNTCDSSPSKKSPSTSKGSVMTDKQEIIYSSSISSSPGKYFGSPKNKSGSPKSPSKRPNKFSPFRKAHRFKSPQNSSQKMIDQYFSKVPPRVNLFKANPEHIHGSEDMKTVQLKGVNKLNDSIISSEPSGKVQKSNNGNVIEEESCVNSVHVSTKISHDQEESKDFSQLLNTEEVDDILRIAIENVQKIDVPISNQGNFNELKNNDQAQLLMKTKENFDAQKLGGSSFFYFKALSNTVKNAFHYIEEADEGYLFNMKEKKILDNFLDVLPKSAQYLYCRLFSRKYSWIRKVAMSYPDISHNLDEELEILSKNDFITLDHSTEELDVILGMLSVAELKKLCKILNKPINGNKSQLVNSLLKLKFQQVIPGSSSEDASDIVRRQASNILGRCAMLTDEPRNIFLKCMRIFTFSYNYQSREELFKNVLERSSSKFIFPKYEFKPAKVFHSLENYDEYEKALLLQSKMEALTVKNNNELIVFLKEAKNNFLRIINDKKKMDFARKMPDFMRRYTAGNVFGRCISANVEKAFNKSNKKNAVEFYECLLSQDIFLSSKRGLLYIRLITIFFHHLKNYEQVGIYFCKAQKDDKVNLVAKSALYDQAELIKSRKNVPYELKLLLEEFNVEHISLNNSMFKPVTVLARAIPSSRPGNKRVYVTEYEQHTELCSVEEVALSYFKSNGYPRGFHDEGRCLIEVLLCCFWSIIYGIPEYESDCVSVFMNWFQDAPADWQSQSFYKRRKSTIEERLQEMAEGGHEYILSLIEKCCDEYENVESVIKWNYVSKAKFTFMREFVECMPVKFIVEASHHLLKDFRAFSSGCPDLTLWNPDEKKSIFVEVKGPNDTLSNNQKIWLQSIKDFGGDATICFVQDTASALTQRTLPGGPSGKKRKALDDSQII